MYICAMNITLKTGESICITRLYKLSDYSEKFNMPISTVNYQMLSGKLPVVKISGIRFVIAPEGEEVLNGDN